MSNLKLRKISYIQYYYEFILLLLGITGGVVKKINRMVLYEKL